MEKVIYKATYMDNTFDIFCWRGTTLGQVWNEIKQFYLPGDKVSITDNYGNSKTFTKGLC